MKTLLVAPVLHSLHGGIPRILRLYHRALVELGGPEDPVEVLVLNDARASAPVESSSLKVPVAAQVAHAGPSVHGSPTSGQTVQPPQTSAQVGHAGPSVRGSPTSGQTVQPPQTSAQVGHAGPSVHGSPTSGQTGASLHHPDPIASPEAFTRSQISNLKSQIPARGRMAGAGRSKLRFAWHLFRLGWRAERVVCGHIHLAPLVWLLQLVRPRLQVFIVGHGIEVWRELSPAQLRAARAARRLVCVSEFSRRELLRHNPALPAERVVVVPNAVEPAWGGQISYLRSQISDARIGGTEVGHAAPSVRGPAAEVEQAGPSLHGSPTSSPTSGQTEGSLRHPNAAARSAVLLTVSRLTSVDREKGVEAVIAALPLVRAEFPDATLRIVGTGDDEARLQRVAATISDDVRAKVGQTGPSLHGSPTPTSGQIEGSLRHPTVRGLSTTHHPPSTSETARSAVTFLGAIDDPALRAEYAGCDVFVLPSRKEGFGLVYLEAMAFGKPCVAADAGGAPEVVTPEVGRLVPYGDVPALAAAIIDLLRQPPDPSVIRAHAGKFSYEALRERLAQALR